MTDETLTTIIYSSIPIWIGVIGYLVYLGIKLANEECELDIKFFKLAFNQE